MCVPLDRLVIRGFDLIELHNIDCMEAMKEMPDQAFDLAIVDPPYGIGASRSIGKEARQTLSYALITDKRWDNLRADKPYFDELFRVSKNQIIWGANYFTDKLPPRMGWICWYKTSSCKGRTFSEMELAFTSFEVAARHFEYSPFQKNGSRIHPTQKPVKLYEWLLKNYAKEGDKIIDTHLGSGSIAIACYNMGYSLTGYEIDVEYYEAAKNRLEEHKRQEKMVFV